VTPSTVSVRPSACASRPWSDSNFLRSAKAAPHTSTSTPPILSRVHAYRREHSVIVSTCMSMCVLHTTCVHKIEDSAIHTIAAI
jgi:hypothetical protein